MWKFLNFPLPMNKNYLVLAKYRVTDEYINILEAGIIDPTKVTRVALENAASVSGVFLTTECVLSLK